MASNPGALFLVLAGLASVGCRPAPPEPAGDGIFRAAFDSSAAAEAIARLTVRCDRCAWGQAGSEAVVLRLTLDDRAPLHLPIVRSGEADYDVMLGPVGAGKHSLAIVEDAELTATALKGANAASWTVSIDQIKSDADRFEALSFAPFVHARPNTVGKFTDVPLLMWYEIEPSERGKRYRYSVIFSNEDGGTPADRVIWLTASTACVRDETPSARSTAATWSLTVSIEMCISRAMILFGMPCSR